MCIEAATGKRLWFSPDSAAVDGQVSSGRRVLPFLSRNRRVVAQKVDPQGDAEVVLLVPAHAHREAALP
jgi:hypothetical protein